jgi:sugar O-acyltransferase (sialic acid O-acetyltransferase NeuD family)
MTPGVIIVGAGGHGRVIADALSASGVVVVGFVDSDEAKHGTVVAGLPVLGDESALAAFADGSVELANGIGSVADLTLRKTVYERLVAGGYRFITVRHPRAIVSAGAFVERGAQLLAGAIVQTDARVGENTIVNTGAIVEHDCVIGRHCHLAPRCVLSGGVSVGDESHIGVGATAVQGVVIGARAFLAAGAVVVGNVPAGCRVQGMPAKEWTI